MKKSMFHIGKAGGRLFLTLGILLLFSLPLLALMISRAPEARAEEPLSAPQALTVDPQFPDISLSNLGSGAPKIEVGSDGKYLAVVYYKIDGSPGVHIKSASKDNGWVTTDYLGSGRDPSVAFHKTINNKVFVVWSDTVAVKFAECTLNDTTAPTCTSKTIPNTSGKAETPDIVVDTNGRLHVAWVDSGNIKTIFSDDNGATWSATIATINAPGSSTPYRNPQLAVTSVLHLAFNRTKPAAISGNPPVGDAILYYRDVAPADASHNWVAVKTFALNSGVNGGYDDLTSPTLGAVGTNVYLAWDGHIVASNDNFFNLMYSQSQNDGASWGTARHVISDTDAAVAVQQNPIKFSLKNTNQIVPQQKSALRPSLTISGSGFALVWQERKNVGCGEGENNSSEIRFAYTTTVWSTEDLLADKAGEYSLDPDLTVGADGTRHFVFMKDLEADTCEGGLASEYEITYRGPFTETKFNVPKEDTEDPNNTPTIYLPIITKN